MPWAWVPLKESKPTDVWAEILSVFWVATSQNLDVTNTLHIVNTDLLNKETGECGKYLETCRDMP